MVVTELLQECARQLMMVPLSFGLVFGTMYGLIEAIDLQVTYKPTQNKLQKP